MIHNVKVAIILLGGAYVIACMLWSPIAQLAQRTTAPNVPTWVALGNCIGLCFGLFLIARA